jgi:hypothetical protein
MLYTTGYYANYGVCTICTIYLKSADDTVPAYLTLTVSVDSGCHD